MCKKIGIAAIAVVAGLLVLNHTKVGSWAKYAFHSIKQQVEDSVPPEVALDKLKKELAGFGPKVTQHINKMAEARTAINNLESDIKDHTARLDDQKKNVLALREEVETIKVSGSKNTHKQAALERAWKSYRTGEESLKAKQVKLEARKERFEAARQQLDSLKAMRETLEGQIEQLEARLEMIRVTEASDNLCFDDPMMGEVKEGIAKLSDKISNMENFRDLNAQYGPEVQGKSGSSKPVSVNEDLLKEIDDHFKPTKGGAKVAADRE